MVDAVLTAEPLYATARSGLPSDADRVAEVAAGLGTPLTVWQRRVADVALERTEAGYVHRSVTTTTPRQCGKSVLMCAVIVDRLRSMPGAVLLYGAQSRMSARSKLLDGWWPIIRRSPYADEFTISRASGFEALRHDNGSIMRLLSSEESSGHGESVDLVVLDECWALEPHIEQAVRPATIRRSGAQIWATSTAGTDRSVWWRGKVDAGRLSVTTEGNASANAYFEWSAPTGANPADPATWRACHPALAEGVVDQGIIAADHDAMPEAEFVRAYLNWWTSDLVDTGWTVFEASVWQAAKR